MRARRICLICAIVGTLLCACGTSTEKVEGLFRDGTVVYIPLKPDATETEPVSTEPAATEPMLLPSEMVPASTNADADSSPSPATTTKPSSGKAPSKKSPSAATAKPTSTEPPETLPPETQLSETLPTETQPETPSVYDISGHAVSALEQDVVAQINVCRSEAGLEPLTLSVTLCAIAAVRAYEACQSWSHTRPDGTQWQSVLSDYGFGYCAAAEDLAHTAGFDAVSIVSKWMDAVDSREDILGADFTTAGVGTYSADGTTYTAVLFSG